MWLALRSVKSINVDFLNLVLKLLVNEVAPQLSSGGWVDPFPNLIPFKILDVLGITPGTSCWAGRHADHSANEVIIHDNIKENVNCAL